VMDDPVQDAPLGAPENGAPVEPVQIDPERAAPAYAGLVTRVIAFTIDAVVINVVAICVAGAVALGLSILSITPKQHGVLVAIGSVVWVGWIIGYFVLFWSSTGQTPGNRIMRIQVLRSDLRRMHFLQAARRLLGLLLAALPLGLGFVPILFTDRRRGFQDRFGGSVVVLTEPPPDPTKTLAPRLAGAEVAATLSANANGSAATLAAQAAAEARLREQRAQPEQDPAP
jgi:uncharacterized RDD family membrane protein YckC